MKKFLPIITLITTSITAFAEYITIALPKNSELNDNRKFYDASVAVYKIEDNQVQDAVNKIINTPSNELKNLMVNPNSATRATKFLKMARLSKAVKVLPINFGKWKVGVFEIPTNSRMRQGMNFFAFEQKDNKLLWNISVNDSFLALIARCNIATPSTLDLSKTQPCPITDKPVLSELISTKQPFLLFKNGALLSTNELADVYEHPASVFYKKIQDVFFSWKIDEYAQFMSPKSKDKFNSQYAGMTQEQKKAMLSDYFTWKKKFLKVMQLSDNEFIVIFKRQKEAQKDQFDVAYITLTSIDGSTGYLEKFGEKTPLDIMMTRYILR